MSLDYRDLKYQITEDDLASTDQDLKKLEIGHIKYWEYDMGESFLDYHGSEIGTPVFSGFLLAKEPTLADSIIRTGNAPFSEVQNFEEVLEEIYDEDDEAAYFKLLEYVCEYVNLTINTRRRVLEALTSRE